MDKAKGKIAYIVSRFPNLPETFILREMIVLDQMGWFIELFPLIKNKQTVIHNEANEWISRSHYSTLLSLKLWIINLISLIRYPVKYLNILLKVIVENLEDPNFLVRALIVFPKAIYMSREMQKQKINHIHAHYATHPALAAWIIHKFVGISYSVSVHAHDIYVSRVMLKTKLGDATFIRAISEFNRYYLQDKIDENLFYKTHVIHCGINPNMYRPRLFPSGAINRFEIINIGSLQPYKGHIYLIKACKLLQEREIPFCCKIIGEGKERLILERLISEKNLQDMVILLGAKSQSEVARILPTAHCYVQPSVIVSSGKMEGIPVSIMEALVCGLPVIATKISGIPELVIEDETGYLVPPRDEYVLADVIELIYNNYTATRQLIQNGRELVLDKYDLTKNVKILADYFAEVVHSAIG